MPEVLALAFQTFSQFIHPHVHGDGFQAGSDYSTAATFASNSIA